jgi:N-acetylglucosamine-6-phosphate deacetylase
MQHRKQKLLFFLVWVIVFSTYAWSDMKAQIYTYSGYLPDERTYVTIHVSDGLIHRITPVHPAPAEEEKVFIAPGLIDAQVNGYASVSFNTKGLTVEKIQKLTNALWQEGVTTFFPTLITNSSALIIENLKVLSESLNNHPRLAHSMPGAFLEGPYISPVDGFRGAHQIEWVRPPDWEEFKMFYEAAQGRIIQIGVAPEIEGAMDFIEKCQELGVMVSLAHHNGSAAQVEAAVDLGVRMTTHLGNGCANLIHRHNNPLWPQLSEDRLTASIIADGHHLSREELRVFYKVKGPGHLILVSDATELAGMPAGTYQWNGKEVVMTEDGMLKYPAQNVLAGASFPVRTGIKNMMKLTGCNLEEAIQMATITPANVYKLIDRGELNEGMSADLILFTIEDNEIIIQQTIVQGEVVYSRDD